MRISVITCTRNPRREYLDRVLHALYNQTYPPDAFEIIIVDNGSYPPLTIAEDRCRVVVEPTAGLTHARLRGILEAKGDWLVFVDDDNVLDINYLVNAEKVWTGFPQLGAIGGRSEPEFEGEPPAWLLPFLSHLAIINVEEDCWSNRKDFEVFPCGAGLCIRRAVANAYAEEVRLDDRRRSLDRSDRSLISCGDTDMVIQCIRSGWGVGRFRSLRLTHLIPQQRLNYAYNKRLSYCIGYSVGVLRTIEGPVPSTVKTKAFINAVLSPLIGKVSGRGKWIEFAGKYGFWQGLCRGRI